MRHSSASDTLPQIRQNRTSRVTRTRAAARRWTSDRFRRQADGTRSAARSSVRRPGRRPSSSMRSWTGPSYITDMRRPRPDRPDGYRIEGIAPSHPGQAEPTHPAGERTHLVRRPVPARLARDASRTAATTRSCNVSTSSASIDRGVDDQRRPGLPLPVTVARDQAAAGVALDLRFRLVRPGPGPAAPASSGPASSAAACWVVHRAARVCPLEKWRHHRAGAGSDGCGGSAAWSALIAFCTDGMARLRRAARSRRLGAPPGRWPGRWPGR